MHTRVYLSFSMVEDIDDNNLKKTLISAEEFTYVSSLLFS